MREKGITIPAKALNAILSTALVCAPMNEVRKILNELGGTANLSLFGLTSVLQSYCSRYADQEAIQHGLPTTDMLKDAPTAFEMHEAARTLMMRLQQSNDTVAWHAYFTYLGLFECTETMMNCYQSVAASGRFSPDSWTLSTLALVHIHNDPPADCDEALALLAKLTAATSLRSHRFAIGTLTQVVLGYTIRIGNAKFARPSCDPNKTIEAQTFMEEACHKYGIVPDKAMLQPLIEAHCNEFVPNVDAAYNLLRHLRPNAKRSLFWQKQASEPQTDLGSYHPLLIACVRLCDVDRALKLIKEMQHLRLPCHATTSLIMQLWGICTTYTKAWDVYKSLRQIGTWTTASYSHIIALCCRLKLYNSTENQSPSPVPASFPLLLLGDMRNERMHPSTDTYTVVLNYYAKSPNATLSGVQATHELIKRDIRLEPDLILINALMNAYNHVNAPAQVLGIWDSLVVLCNNTKSIEFLDDVSLVIVLDACGHAKLLSAARRALDSAQQLEKRVQHGKILGKNVIDAWVECLARCGELNEAVEAAFSLQELADKKTVETLLRFAASAHVRRSISTKQWESIRGRVRAKYPHLWDEVATIK
ncbi:hypothetical protein MYAM1_000905 [Malassezia yamatoensis]|uniref:Pentatricopeptide repeat-containing protein n=1 Tax=Malassezia yamatoensis TaxID=253288 RepID=A0AAJ5YSW5_9BASI|nr:hypothetical protein MYAM1_000905 [Malassezia yamatoensis]